MRLTLARLILAAGSVALLAGVGVCVLAFAVHPDALGET